LACKLCRCNHFDEMPFHYRWEGCLFRARRCRDCGLIGLNPLPSDDELHRLYAADYFDEGLHGLDKAGTGYEDLADDREIATRDFIDRVIRSRHPGAKRLFEIGSAMGHFLAVARESGFEVTGAEISDAAADRARERFGLELIRGNIEQLDLSAEHGRWDVVYAGDLLEHLREPLRMLETAADLLAPDGICVMVLPGTYNLLFTKLATALLGLAGRSRELPDKPYHLHEFTTTTARLLFERVFSDVEIVCDATPPGGLNLKDRSPAYLLKGLFQYVNAPLTRLTNRFGDRMTVVARNSL